LSSGIYVGTKAHALRGTLMDRPALEKLAESTSLEEFVNRLRGTAYSESLTELATPYTARNIELLLRERLAEVHYSLMSTAGKYRIFGLYYLRYIGWDLKTALKAKALDKQYEETMEYIDMRAEELVGRRDLIVKVLAAKDVNEAVSLLSGSEFSEDVAKALAAYSTKGEARVFDVYIDHAVLSAISKEYASNYKVYSSYRSTDVAGVGDMVSVDIDAYNTLAVLRAKLWDLPEEDVQSLIITPTYRVTGSQLARMAGTDSVQEAVKSVAESYQDIPQGAQSDEALVDGVEETFTLKMKETAGRSFVWQGLGVSTALALVKLLEFEISNLATIAIGIEANIEPSTVLAKLRF